MEAGTLSIRKTYGGGIAVSVLEKLNYLTGANSISVCASIGAGTEFHHGGLGCVVHENSRIGENCHIFQNVTIGQKLSEKDDAGVPVIGNHVVIGAGSVLLGNIKVGDFSIIGANSVVVHDVAPGTAVAGNPAHKIKKEKER